VPNPRSAVAQEPERDTAWGMAPTLAPPIHFKLRFAVTDDMLAGQGRNAVAAI